MAYPLPGDSMIAMFPRPQRFFARLVTAAALALCALALARADIFDEPPATMPTDSEPPPATRPAPPPPPFDDYLSNLCHHLESDVVQLGRDREDAADPRLDLRIDARLVVRWLLLNARTAPPGSDAQSAAYVHAKSMLATIPRVDELAAGPATFTLSQQAAMHRLHDLTYRLGDVVVVATSPAQPAEAPPNARPSSGDQDLDHRSVETATDLVAILAIPGETTLTPMRPPKTAAIESEKSATTAAAPPSIDDLTSRVRQAAIGVPLRRALLAVASAAQDQSNHHQDAATLRDKLQSAVELAEGLQANTGVDPAQRQAAEDSLTDALVLLADSRTRSSGDARLDALDHYRRLITRVASMRIPPDLADDVAPAVKWANDHPDDSRLLDAVSTLLTLQSAPATMPQQPRPPEQIVRCADALSQQFVQQRTAALASLQSFAAQPDTGVNDVIRNVAAMQRIADLQQLLHDLPAALQTLTALHPRPSGGIEDHLWQILNHVAAPQPSASRASADDQLRRIEQLADDAEHLSPRSAAHLPSDAVMQAWAGAAYPDADARCRLMLMTAANALAVGIAPDDRLLAHLQWAAQLRAALDDAAALEQSLDQAYSPSSPLWKWADWQIPRAEASSLLDPYRAAMSRAFAGLAAGNDDPIKEFFDQQQRLAPLLTLIRTLPDLAASCANLPDDDAALLCRLATPAHDAPFAAERFATLAADTSAWSAASTWTASTQPSPGAVSATADPTGRLADFADKAAGLIADRIAEERAH